MAKKKVTSNQTSKKVKSDESLTTNTSELLSNIDPEEMQKYILAFMATQEKSSEDRSPKRKLAAKTNSSKGLSKARERWLRVGKRRAEAVLLAMDQLEKCSNSYNYKYESSEVDQIIKRIKERLTTLQKAFDVRKPKDESNNTFDF